MNNKLILPITILVASMALVPNSMALGKNHDKQHKEQHERTPKLLTKKAAKHLDLSDQQQLQIKDVYAQMKSSMAGEREQMKALKKQWKTLASADVLDETTLNDVALQIAQIKAKMRVQGLKTKKALGAILTPEQKEKMSRMKHKRRHHNYRH
jgi:periplasmic protein CpxP/Spy